MGAGALGLGRSREGPSRYTLVGGPPGCAGPGQRRPLAGSRGGFDGDSAAQAGLRDKTGLDWSLIDDMERQEREAQGPAGLGWARDWAGFMLDWPGLAGGLGDFRVFSGPVVGWLSAVHGLWPMAGAGAAGAALLGGWDAGSRPLPRSTRITNRQPELAGGGMQVPLSSVAWHDTAASPSLSLARTLALAVILSAAGSVSTCYGDETTEARNECRASN